MNNTNVNSPRNDWDLNTMQVAFSSEKEKDHVQHAKPAKGLTVTEVYQEPPMEIPTADTTVLENGLVVDSVTGKPMRQIPHKEVAKLFERHREENSGKIHEVDEKTGKVAGTKYRVNPQYLQQRIETITQAKGEGEDR